MTQVFLLLWTFPIPIFLTSPFRKFASPYIEPMIIISHPEVVIVFLLLINLKNCSKKVAGNVQEESRVLNRLIAFLKSTCSYNSQEERVRLCRMLCCRVPVKWFLKSEFLKPRINTWQVEQSKMRHSHTGFVLYAKPLQQLLQTISRCKTAAKAKKPQKDAFEHKQMLNDSKETQNDHGTCK